jgi:hypothetical protein
MRVRQPNSRKALDAWETDGGPAASAENGAPCETRIKPGMQLGAMVRLLAKRKRSLSERDRGSNGKIRS